MTFSFNTAGLSRHPSYVLTQVVCKTTMGIDSTAHTTAHATHCTTHHTTHHSTHHTPQHTPHHHRKPEQLNNKSMRTATMHGHVREGGGLVTPPNHIDPAH